MTQLSNRTYPMLRVFAQAGPGFFMTIEEAQRFDQRPFRAMGMHGWISYRPGKGFHITSLGIAAWDEFRQTKIIRKNPRAPITAFFDVASYGLAHHQRATG